MLQIERRLFDPPTVTHVLLETEAISQEQLYQLAQEALPNASDILMLSDLEIQIIQLAQGQTGCPKKAALTAKRIVTSLIRKNSFFSKENRLIHVFCPKKNNPGSFLQLFGITRKGAADFLQRTQYSHAYPAYYNRHLLPNIGQENYDYLSQALETWHQE